MNNNVTSIGMELDDTQYHESAVYNDSGEVVNFQCRPTLKGLLGQLNILHNVFPSVTFSQASYVSYTHGSDTPAVA